MNEPRVLAASLARRLNVDPAALAALCERHQNRLESLGHTVDGLLTERQALYLCTKLDTDEAFEAQQEILEAASGFGRP